MKKSLLVFAVCVAVLFAQDTMDVQKQKAAVAELKKTMMAELKVKMSESPASAVEFCSKNALELTKQIAVKNGVNIKRVSIKNRNLQNSADLMDAKVITAFEDALKKNKKLPEFATLNDGGKLKYYEPMVISEACVVCHGKEGAIAKETADKIKKIYPNDKATGYEIGDLRGVIVVW
jgi:hypothetical protein